MQVFHLFRRVCRCVPSGSAAVGLGLLLFCAAPSSAQALPEQPTPAYVRIVDGHALLEREGNADTADAGMVFVPGDRLRTDRGRVEVLFPDGTALDIDEFSDITLQEPQALRLEAGRAWISVPRESTARIQIDTPAATAYSNGPGEFRVAVLGTRGGQTEMLVTTGLGELVADRGSVKLQAGEKSTAIANDVPSRPERFAAHLEAFDNWALAQRNDRDAGRSGQYLPADLRVHGDTLDENGNWQYESTYGYVWYPTVAVGWHPYYNGYWATVPAYGWIWIGAERWAWPTHHYGRWGHANRGWFWIPEQHWGPAWVSWGAAPGYVSWCPLGFNNRPVYSFSAAAGAGWGAGWVVMPRDRFGVGHDHVGHYAVAPHSLPAGTPFVTQNTPPVPASRTAVRRVQSAPQNQPGQVAGGGRGQAIPRGNGGRSGAGPQPAQSGTSASRANGPNGQSPMRIPAASALAGANDPALNGNRARALPRSPASETRQPTARRYPFGDFRRPDGSSTSTPAQSGPASASTASRAIPRPRSADAPPAVDSSRFNGQARPRGPQRDSSTPPLNSGFGTYRGLPSRAPANTERRSGSGDAPPAQQRGGTPATSWPPRADGGAGAPSRFSSAGAGSSSGSNATQGSGSAVRRSPPPTSSAGSGSSGGNSGGSSAGSSSGAVPRNGGAAGHGGGPASGAGPRR